MINDTPINTIYENKYNVNIHPKYNFRMACKTDTVEMIKHISSLYQLTIYGGDTSIEEGDVIYPPFIFETDGWDNNGFLLACQHNPDTKVISYLINVLGMDINSINEDGDNGFLLACRHNNITVIKYLVDVLKIDITHTNECDLDGFLCAVHSNSLDVIKYLVDTFDINVHRCDGFGNNAFILSCMNNSNVDVIDYVVNVLGVNINHKTKDGYNGFLAACLGNNNVHIIKYLVEVLGMDTNIINVNGNNGILEAVIRNNINVVRYLVEELVMDVDYKNYDNESIFMKSLWNKNINISIYIADKSKTIHTLNHKKCNQSKYIKIISGMRNHINVNNIIQNDKTSCKYNMKEIINTINPLLLNDMNIKEFDIDDPYEMSFRVFKNNVDKLDCILPTRECHKDNTKDTIYKSTTKDILFRHDGNIYYGCRQYIFSNVLPFDDIDIDDESIIELNTGCIIPKYVIEIYIQAIYGTFDMNDILLDDLKYFLRLIDQYPTTTMTIRKLEHELLLYIRQNSISIDINRHDKTLTYVIGEYVLRYGCKHIYVEFIHNVKYAV